MLNKSKITEVLACIAVLTAILSYGAERWYYCIIPIGLLLAVCYIKYGFTAGNIYGIFPALMLFSAAVALCCSRADKHKGIYELEKLICFFAAFYAGGTVRMRRYIFIGAFAAAVIGLLSYCGLIKIDEFVMADHGIMRLQSVFRYANTAAVVFGCGYFLSTDMPGVISWRIMSVLTLLAMYMTFSRAAVIIFLVLGGVLVFFQRDKRKRFLVDNGICIIIAAAVLAAYIVHGRGGYMPAETMVKRFVYMRDAMGVLKDHMMIGTGGGSWRYLQYTAQSADYTVMHIHNGWLEFWLENGFIFVLSLLSLTACAVRGAVRGKDLTLAASVMLIALHSLVDFDLSYGAVLILYGSMIGSCLQTGSAKKGMIILNGCVLAVACAAVLYMGTEFALRYSFEDSYIEQKTENAAKKAYALKKLCPFDSELRSSIAALDTANAGYEIAEAERLSPLDPEIAKARIEYGIKTKADDVLERIEAYINKAPKQERTYALAKGYAKTALDKGLCSEEEYNVFADHAETQRIEHGVIDRNRLLEEFAEKNREETR